MKVYQTPRALGFVETFTTNDGGNVQDDPNTIDEAQAPGGFMAAAGDFITAHKTGVFAACAGLFALAIFGEMAGRGGGRR